MEASISFLPSETLLEIFSYLDIIFAFKSVSRVCKLWRCICFDPYLWKCLDFTGGELGKNLNDTTFKKTIEICAKTRYINLSRTNVTMKGLEIIAHSCPEVEYLDLSFCSRLRSSNFDLLLSLPKLKYLNLVGSWRLTDPSLSAVDPFLKKNIKLGISLEVFSGFVPLTDDVEFNNPNNSNETTSDIDTLKLEQLKWLDINLSPEVASNFLNNQSLIPFSKTMKSLGIGSKCSPDGIHSLPSQIGELRSLTNLSILTHNMDSLPKEFTQLTSLKTLVISNGRLGSFEVMPEAITKLTSISSLNLSWNKLRRISDNIGLMCSITKLNLCNNELRCLPPDIGQLVGLKRLNLSSNKLTALPASMGKLTQLQRLVVSNNSIVHIPFSSFDGMNSLEVLDLQSNKLSCVPVSIALPLLKELHLNDNILESVPRQLGTDSPSLKKLFLHQNRLAALPEQICSLSGLKHLSLTSNYVEFLPRDIGNLQSLKVLEISSNRLRELPPTISSLRKLRRINLQSNSFPNLNSLHNIYLIESLKSVQFDSYLQDSHFARCMCKFCVFARFDEAHFDDIVEGDTEFEMELIALFFHCTESDFVAMREAMEAMNYSGIFFVSHKIKGALSNMGAVKLSHMCSLLEKHSRSQDIHHCRLVFEQLQIEYCLIKQVLMKRLQKNGRAPNIQDWWALHMKNGKI